MEIRKKILAIVSGLAMLTSFIVFGSAVARNNMATIGLSLSYDYNDRTSDLITPEREEEAVEGEAVEEEEYRRLLLTPHVHFISTTQKDEFEIRLAPSLNYDLVESETDIDNNLYTSAARAITRRWWLRATDTLIRSDFHEIDTVSGIGTEVSVGEDSSVNDAPELSGDAGRRRYWRNNFRVSSEHMYGQQDNMIVVGFEYDLLRNDESDVESYEDYNRYVVDFRNDHAYNRNWDSSIALSFVRGEYENTDTSGLEELVDERAPESGVGEQIEELSNDLKEYHLLATLNHTFSRQNSFSYEYNYIGTEYDEIVRDDGQIHQGQISWRHDFSSRLYINLGAGPSYEKTENREANWGENGIGEINYTILHGSIGLIAEKGYDVDNFSGTDERGFVDYWDTRFIFDYELIDNITLNGHTGYRYEDRTDPSSAVSDLASSGELLAAEETESLTDLEDYTTKQFSAGIGVTYAFFNNYNAGISYVYTNLESDRNGDDYDDHRLLITLSWQADWHRW